MTVDCKGHDVLLFPAHSENRMATLLMPLPDSDFDPTESGVPWLTMRDHGHHVVFATPTGRTALADPKMVTGEGLGVRQENDRSHQTDGTYRLEADLALSR